LFFISVFVIVDVVEDWMYYISVDTHVIRGLFVNYWDTACNSHTHWRKDVHIWYNHTSTFVYDKHRRKLYKWSYNNVVYITWGKGTRST